MMKGPTVAQWIGKSCDSSHAEESIRADSPVQVLEPLTWVGNDLPYLTGVSPQVSLLTRSAAWTAVLSYYYRQLG